MADLNQIYAPTTDYQDPDIVVATAPGTFPWSDSVKLYLPDEVRAMIRTNNANAVETAQAVVVPYTGSTSDERAAWVLSIIHAVDNRVEFIKQRSNQLLTSLQGKDDVAYNASLKILETGLSLLPGIGSAVSYISNQANVESAIETVKIQNLIQGYANDLTQLSGIRAQLLKEYTGSADPTAGAPTPVPAYVYWIGGAIILLLILLIIRNKNRQYRR